MQEKKCTVCNMVYSIEILDSDDSDLEPTICPFCGSENDDVLNDENDDVLNDENDDVLNEL